MSKTPVATFADLAILDDAILARKFETLFRQVLDDLLDRPTLDRDRTITLKCKYRPITNEQGQLDEVAVDFELGLRIPSAASKTYVMAKGPGGALLFDELSPESSRQETLPLRATGKA